VPKLIAPVEVLLPGYREKLEIFARIYKVELLSE
jgi:hypothetical protein